VPLVDVSTANGTTEFIAGTHDDRLFEQVASGVISTREQDPAAQHKLAVRAEVAAGTAVVFDARLLHRGLVSTSMEERPVMYFTMARDWFQEKYMFQNKSIVQSQKDTANQKNMCPVVSVCNWPVARPKGYRVRASALHYRFDLLLLERLLSDNIDDQLSATMNVAAVLASVALTTGDREALCREFVYALNEDAVERKHETPEEARRLRREARRQVDDEDFATIATDMSDVDALYELTARIILQETALLSKLCFTANEFGVSTALAMLKAFASCSMLEGVGISVATVGWKIVSRLVLRAIQIHGWLRRKAKKSGRSELLWLSLAAWARGLTVPSGAADPFGTLSSGQTSMYSTSWTLRFHGTVRI
jgi:hypothetical protein